MNSERASNDVFGSTTMRCAVVLLSLLIGGCSLTPWRTVLPYPDHVQSGIEAGDTVRVTTTDGQERELVVKSVSEGTLYGARSEVAFEEIAAIRKRSKEPIRNPCDDGTPVGCSVPTAVTLTSEFHGRYAARFEEACIAHDYCYRHGSATYGDTRRDCDVQFLEDMRESCGGGLLDLDPRSRAECYLAASEFHVAVRRAGEDRFIRDTGKYCEYRGPAEGAP